MYHDDKVRCILGSAVFVALTLQQNKTGAFRGEVLMKTFAAHLAQYDHDRDPSLIDFGRASGALAVCAAAVSRCLC